MGALRVRFGEVEQRGIAPTARGRALYDRLVAAVDERVAAGEERTTAAVAVWRNGVPATERALAAQGLAFFTYRVARAARASARPAGDVELVDAGVLVAEPIVYEDFLPRSAAGIFRSNLAGAGTREAPSEDLGEPPGRGGAPAGFPQTLSGPPYDLGRLSDVLGTPVHDPMDLYAAERAASLRAAEATLGVRITTTASSVEPSCVEPS
jgi:uncharacterized glyoxalase superfamily metalloenzyme YdcJ